MFNMLVAQVEAKVQPVRVGNAIGWESLSFISIHALIVLCFRFLTRRYFFLACIMQPFNVALRSKLGSTVRKHTTTSGIHICGERMKIITGDQFVVVSNVGRIMNVIVL
jgi:hypothetical protein